MIWDNSDIEDTNTTASTTMGTSVQPNTLWDNSDIEDTILPTKIADETTPISERFNPVTHEISTSPIQEDKTKANTSLQVGADVNISDAKIDYGKGMYNAITKKKGTKATRNNNPGNITGMGGKLLYGAIGFAKSKVGDTGDHSQLIYSSPQEGFAAMDKLARTKYSNGSIKTEFKRWQTDIKSFKKKLHDLKRFGVDINKSYASLDPKQQKLFRKIWSQHEGYKGEFY